MAEPFLLIRADATHRMGAGHVMRSLAVAQAWRDGFGQVAFVCADIAPSLSEQLADENIETIHISSAAGSAEDALDLLAIAEDKQAAALILDGYQFLSEYQKIVTDFDGVTMAIDDFGNFGCYMTDFVLNQNLGADANLYADRMDHTELLLGTKYALIRREFLVTGKCQREPGRLASRILVTLGGSDPDNRTAVIIKGLQQLDRSELKVHVIVGAMNQHYEELVRQLGTDERFLLLRSVRDMATEYLWADIAVAAGGSSNWEMCYFGLPRLVVVIADNQRDIAEQLQRAHVAINLGEASQLVPEHVTEAAELLLADQARRDRARECGRYIVDGKGALRCVHRLLNLSASI